MLVTCLNDELAGLSREAIREETWTVAEGFLGLCVKEEIELDVGRRQVVTCEGQLDDGDVSLVTKVGSQSTQLSVALDFTGDERSVFGCAAHSRLSAWSEVERARAALEAYTGDGDGDSARDLAEGWVDACDGVGGTNDFADVERKEVIEPAVVPAAEDDKSALALIVAHCSILAGSRPLFVLGHDLHPAHALEVHEAGRVDAGAEGTWLSLTEVGAFTAEDEVLPGWDSLDHHGCMVPSRHTIEDVRITPFSLLEVEDN